MKIRHPAKEKNKFPLGFLITHFQRTRKFGDLIQILEILIKSETGSNQNIIRSKIKIK